ncbi:MAG TPA: EVE domain-containing protein [Vicinamibacteria bacterium]
MWLVKTEPTAYSYAELAKAKRAVWDGVKNTMALRNLRAMKLGERVFVYHTGDEKAVVGVAEVVREAYMDPKGSFPSQVVVDLQAVGPLKRAVTLAEIKARAEFKESPLVRQGRLSVVPLTAVQAKLIETLGK